MTEGDLAFLLSTLNDGYDRVDIHEFIDNVNFYIQDRDKYQRLETRIPEKMLEPLDKADRDVKNAKKIRRLDRKASMGKRSAGKKTERSEIDSQEREETSELANLKEEIAKKIRKNNLDTQKFYKECKSRGRGTVEDRDFEDIIVKDIGFKATNKELDILCDHYGKEVKKGYIDYRSFDDDIYDINKRAKQKTKWRTTEVDPPKDFSPDKSKIDGEERKEEEKVQELEYSYRPSDNMPDDIRYSMKNTVVGRFPDSRTQRKHKVKIAEYILQDIIKATYTRD